MLKKCQCQLAMTREESLLIKNGILVPMDDDSGKIIENGAVFVEGKKIVAVGRNEDVTALSPGSSADKVLDAKGMVIMPGLVDLHYHTAIAKGVNDGMPLDRFLDKFWYPKLRLIRPEEVYWAALNTYAEAIKSEIVPCADKSAQDLQLAHVHRVTGLIERAIDAIHSIHRANVGPLTLRSKMFEVLIPTEQFKKFDRVRGETRDIARQFFEHRQRALAPTVVDCLGNIGARARGNRWTQIFAEEIGEKFFREFGGLDAARVVQQIVADEIADVSDHPRLAGLDEEVVPQLLDVRLHEIGLRVDQAQERAQRVILLHIAFAIQCG